MRILTTPGALLGPTLPPMPALEDPGPVGIVSSNLGAIADYLETCDSPYVVIRSLADVPARLGGLALLDGVQLGDELTAALTAALLMPAEKLAG